MLAVALFEGHRLALPDGPPAFDRLSEEVDESNFSLSEWLSSLFREEWAQENSRKSNFATTLGYVKCCAMSLAGGKRHGRAGLEHVEDMLRTQGFDGLTSSKTP